MTDEMTSPPDSNGDGPDDSLAERTRQLHRHLEATAELPIERRTNRWLGEAEAIATDIVTSDLGRETVLERVSKVERLLSEVDDTGHEGANDHLEAAKGVCRGILEEHL
ncbi:hypothetical protein [Natronorubrum halophilum]|uniref:hypothetical protein n=1 Tax=Natronorubrum halophilum TaxID=1702106 RepID=UPI0037423E4C